MGATIGQLVDATQGPYRVWVCSECSLSARRELYAYDHKELQVGIEVYYRCLQGHEWTCLAEADQRTWTYTGERAA